MINLKEFFLTVWDSDFNVLGIIDNIISLQWTKELNNAGSFNLTIPVNKEHLKLFQLGSLITKNTFNKEGDLLEPYVINYIEFSVDQEGNETLEIQGSSLLTWFSQRIISNVSEDILQGKAFDILKELITLQCITPENESRIIPNLSIVENNQLEEKTTYTITKYSSLLDSVSSICQSMYYGIEILMNSKEKKYIVNIYKGEDKSLGDSDSPIIFSENMNNVFSDSYIESFANYKNTAYIYGTIDNKQNSEENEKEIIVQYPVGNNFVGIERYETAINCSSPDINGKKMNLTVSNFSAVALALGYENLSLNQEIKSFTGDLNTESNLTYKKDFNVGDIVTCLNNSWNLNINSLIVAVSEEYSVNGLNISITFGYPLPSIVKK
ncbi:MAG: siphovirus ReqiPepy6 Gp37-like family protein [Sarcina sp.]